MSSRAETFVSVAVVVDKQRESLRAEIEALGAVLAPAFSDYEIVLVVSGPARRFLGDAQMTDILMHVDCIRVVQLAAYVHRDIARAAGLENAIGDYVVLYDPATDPVDIVVPALEACRTRSDVVVGVSTRRRPAGYRLVRWATSPLLAAIDYSLPANATEFRVASRRAINAMIGAGRFHQQVNMRLQKTGYAAEALHYAPIGDEALSERTLPGAARSLLRLLVFNSTRPLRWMAGLGLLGSCIAILFGLYSVLVRLLVAGVVEGWTTMVLFMSMQFMLIFIILAFISEYLSRLLDEQRGNADYSVVFERHSAVMIRDDRINVVAGETTPEPQRALGSAVA